MSLTLVGFLISTTVGVCAPRIGFVSQNDLSKSDPPVPATMTTFGAARALELHKLSEQAHFLCSRGSDKAVLVVAIGKDGTPQLNPPLKVGGSKMQYRDMPQISRMSEEFCSSLFGSPNSSAKDFSKNYGLIEKGKDGKTLNWNLELRFENDAVSEYKLSGPNVVSKDWIQVTE